ncbi:TPT-domain-containing protein [Phellopilus nigrolimitatus]|nr:TPT-domain-containing protein [Phellopilus nigrolimitatus]
MASGAAYNRLEAEPDGQAYGHHNDDLEDLDLPEFVDRTALSKEDRKRLWWRNAIVNLMFIAAWFIVAIILSVYNKWMFSPDRYGFSWPLFVTMLHMFIQFVLAALVRNVWPLKFRPLHNPNKKDYGRKVIPTAIATGLDIGLSNFSLKTITLSFYTMCKSSSLIFVLFFAFLFKLEKFSLRLVGVILLIFVGVLMMVATETQFVFLGFVLVTSASALGGLRWSLTHLLLKQKEVGMDNPAAAIYWLAPVMGVSLAFVSLLLEDWASIFGSKFFDSMQHALSSVLFLAIPGTMAFFMVLTEYYIIQRAGVVPMSIAGIAKEVTQISVSAWLFGDELTPLNVAGVAVTVCGIALYTYHKYRKTVDLQGPGNFEQNNFEQNVALSRGDYVHDGSSLELDERIPLTLPGSITSALESSEKDNSVIPSNVGHAEDLVNAENQDDGSNAAFIVHSAAGTGSSSLPIGEFETSGTTGAARRGDGVATERTRFS